MKPEILLRPTASIPCRPPLLLLLAGLLLASAPAAAAGRIWGRVRDAQGRPASGVSLMLQGGTGGVSAETLSDVRGRYGFLSVPPGLYALRAAKSGLGAAERKALLVADDSDIRLDVFLASDARGALDGASSESLDFAASGARTTLAAEQIELLPSGHSLGSLIENQDFSATTNRIDVGGLWAAYPTLYGARGGVSWSQNVTLLNGLDISDPYDGGRALVLPDVFSLASVSLANGVLPIQAATPGGQLSLTPRSGTDAFHGGFRAFYTDARLSSDNVTPALEAESLFESDSFSRASEYDFHLGGPLSRGGATFWTAWSQRSIGRDLAGFDPEDKTSLISGLFAAEIPVADNRLNLVWIGQSASYGSYGADRDVAWEATSRRSVLSGVLQAVYETRSEDLRHSRLGLSWTAARARDDLQEGAGGFPRVDLFTTAASGSPSVLEDSFRQRLALTYDAEALWLDGPGGDHRFEYGARLLGGWVDRTTTVPDHAVLRYYGQAASEAALYAGPFRSRLSSLETRAYVQDALTFGSGLTLRLGLHASWLAAGNKTASVGWLSLSPRAELTVPLSRRRTSLLKLSLARYDLQLPLSALLWGDPNAPGALIYAWTDADGDGTYSPGEQGALLRREGPAFSAVDEDLQRPRLDELAVGFVRDFGAGWRLALTGFLRRTNRLLETVNTGVADSDYAALTIRDDGDDRIPGSYDDLTFTVYDRSPAALGQDFFLLTNPESGTRVSTYRGLDLSLVKAWDGRFLFYLAMTAMEIVGTTGPGNTEWENDDGMIGALYDDPNASINARGRMRFDRAYTIRLGASLPLPLGARLAVVAKYYDGQPFARMIVVEGLNQGLLAIMAHARGVARYEFNMTVDTRLEKSIRLGRGGSLRLLADVFNVFNQGLATEESEWTGPAFPLRYATRIQSPRVIRAGVQISF